jgi:hypothetical protein
MLGREIDGVSADDRIAVATLDAINRFAAERPTVYLPTHDPASAERLSNRAVARVPHHEIDAAMASGPTAAAES